MRTVLLVDGDLEKRQTLRFALECAGWCVSEATCAEDALAVARASREPLAVLLAQWMDATEGGRILHEAAGNRTRLGRHRYLLLANCPRRTAEPLREPMERLAVEVVRSPFDVGHLLDVLEAVPAGAPARPSRDHSGVAMRSA